jgi:AcrR family transcriptional regulator
VEQGYEETTVDQIAAAAGMSKRTFFRYFASKDDLVIGKYDLFGDRTAEALESRPTDEPVWDSMRRVFDIATVYVVDGTERARNEAMERILQSTPTLNARYPTYTSALAWRAAKRSDLPRIRAACAAKPGRRRWRSALDRRP